MARIIATAENYAFGPASKLITVCEQLIKRGHYLIFVGEGTAYQLASKLKFHEIHRYNTDSPEFMTWGEDLFKSADALLSSVDRSSVLLAKKVGLPVIWLDMLFLWWDAVPEFLYDIELYIQQNSVKNERNMKLFSHKIKNMKIVGPIVDLKYKNIPQPNQKQLLVAFGGTEAAGWYKVGRDSFYPYTFTRLILESVDTSKYEKVIFAGNETIMKELNDKYGSAKYSFTILSHDEWLRAIAESSDILINPGLEAPLEAIAYEKPIFFLPPYNSSAYVELDEFRSHGVADSFNSIHFSDYYKHKNYLGRDLKLIMKEFLVELKSFENSKDILEDCAKRINAYLNASDLQKEKQFRSQQSFMKKFGTNALSETVNIIHDCVESIKNK
jgi:hypothetical protein